MGKILCEHLGVKNNAIQNDLHGVLFSAANKFVDYNLLITFQLPATHIYLPLIWRQPRQKRGV
jgi:hypothetical protein